MGTPTLRKMRAVDMVKLSKITIPKFYGVVVVDDGEEIGSGAIVWGDGGRAYLCLEITERLRQKPVFMVRTAKALINAAKETGVELYSVEAVSEKTSERFMSFLGFKPTGETKNGERVLKWQQS